MNVSDLYQMPQKLMQYEPQSKRCEFAFLSLPRENHELFNEVSDNIRKITQDQVYEAEFTV